MNGVEILKGLTVTLKHFLATYIIDLIKGKKHYRTTEGILSRAKADTRGIFTVQYPEEKLPVPEEFRFLPFLVFDEGEEGVKTIRCTACGICSKVCPPQCIWIVRSADPQTGKPIPSPAEFSIDVDICMNCGFCAEFCPFDAIKMDHDYEIASYDRSTAHIYRLEKLLKPAKYYAHIRPINAEREEREKAEKEAAKTAKKTN